MTDRVTVELKGARETVSAFKQLREFISKGALRKSVREAARLMFDAIMPRVPVLTGRLMDNIRIRLKVTRETIRARVTVNTQGKAGDSRNAFYWRFLELGFRTRSGEERRIPFVSVAFDQTQQEAAQQVIDEVELAIKKAEAKARRRGAI